MGFSALFILPHKKVMASVAWAKWQFQDYISQFTTSWTSFQTSGASIWCSKKEIPLHRRFFYQASPLPPSHSMQCLTKWVVHHIKLQLWMFIWEVYVHTCYHIVSRVQQNAIMFILGIPSWCGLRQCVTSDSSGCWKKIGTQDKERHLCAGFGSGSSGSQPLQRPCGIQDKRNGFPQTSELHCGAEDRPSSWKLCHKHTQTPELPNGCFCGSSGMRGCWRRFHKLHKHSQLLHGSISCALSSRPAC